MTREEIIEHLDSIVGTYEILLGHGVNSDILDVDDIEAIKEAISALSKADVRENIHGHWELKYPTREEIIYCQERYFCSNCKGYVVDRIARLEFNFCPNCGADMRGE